MNFKKKCRSNFLRCVCTHLLLFLHEINTTHLKFSTSGDIKAACATNTWKNNSRKVNKPRNSGEILALLNKCHLQGTWPRCHAKERLSRAALVVFSRSRKDSPSAHTRLAASGIWMRHRSELLGQRVFATKLRMRVTSFRSVLFWKKGWNCFFAFNFGRQPAHFTLGTQQDQSLGHVRRVHLICWSHSISIYIHWSRLISSLCLCSRR